MQQTHQIGTERQWFQRDLEAAQPQFLYQKQEAILLKRTRQLLAEGY
jgi:hypothetical protein